MKGKPDQTSCIHGGEAAGHAYRSVTVPIVQSTTFNIASTQALKNHVDGTEPILDYARYTNPTVRAAEQKLAALEQSDEALVTSSGMSALSTTFFALLKPGHHVLYMGDYYRPSGDLITGMLGKFGVTSSMVPFGDRDTLLAEVDEKQPRMLFIELPSNPHCRVFDLTIIPELKERCRSLKIVVDATFAGPHNIRSLEHGADLVLYSLTKYLAGHNDIMAGAVLGPAPMVEAIREVRGLLGTNLDPQSAYLLIRGLKTYTMRMERHNQSSQQIAEFLDQHDDVEVTFYPGLPGHPDHEIANRQLAGYGGVVSFVVKGGLERAGRVVDNVRCVQHAASLGGVESLIHQPAVFTYSDMPPEIRAMIGVEEGLLRLSVGLEEVGDIISDLDQALKNA